MKKLICISLVMVLSFTLVSCGGVTFPSEEQILEDIMENYSMYITRDSNNLYIYLSEPNLSGATEGVDYLVCPATSFEFMEDPKTRDGYVYINGILTLETFEEFKVRVSYRIYDDGSCEYSGLSKNK